MRRLRATRVLPSPEHAANAREQLQRMGKPIAWCERAPEPQPEPRPSNVVALVQRRGER